MVCLPHLVDERDGVVPGGTGGMEEGERAMRKGRGAIGGKGQVSVDEEPGSYRLEL
jgi:hypothetical protein